MYTAISAILYQLVIKHISMSPQTQHCHTTTTSIYVLLQLNYQLNTDIFTLLLLELMPIFFTGTKTFM